MKSSYLLPMLALAGSCSLFVASASALSVNTAVTQFEQNVRDYNLITFGNASFSHTHDSEGGIAVGGNLILKAGGTTPLANNYGTGDDPSVYVKGQLQLSPGAILQVNKGYVSLPNQAGAYWNAADKRLFTSGVNNTGPFVQGTNSLDPRTSANPTTNPGPAGWDFDALQSSFSTISSTLAAATATGTYTLNGQTLGLSGSGSGVSIFSLDLNTFNWSGISQLKFDVPSDALYVINVLNAQGKSLFANLNTQADGTSAQRILWNFVGSGDVTLNNNGEIFGSLLAEDWNITTLNKEIKGQVVAGSFDRQAQSELHYAPFTPPDLPPDRVPDGMSSGLALGSLLGALAFWRRRKAA